MTEQTGEKKSLLLRSLPSIEELLQNPAARVLLAEFGRNPLAASLRETLEELRAAFVRGSRQEPAQTEAVLAETTLRLRRKRAPALCRVINATGVILHTGLGRAVLPESALAAIQSEQRGYSLLEIERDSGERGIRETSISALLREVTGAEAATVVNNNAGATLLILCALARGREVIVSRGQLVEIGGSFRIPDVMEQSGARLVEVGTTNKTHLSDYETHIRADTALLLRVHTSNYRIVGFSQTPSLSELVALGRKHGLPVMDDLGSGALVDVRPWGLSEEPTPQSSLAAGADVVCFSGDKLLGGPQAGIILGKKETVAKIRAHPLFRALRVDKLTLTALEATLKLYRDPDRLLQEHPTLRMIALPVDELEKSALELAARLQKIPGLSVEILDDASEIGGGSVPGQTLPSKVVAVRSSALSLEELSRRLRVGTPCIFPRVQRDRVLFDVRTLLPGDSDEIAASLLRILS